MHDLIDLSEREEWDVRPSEPIWVGLAIAQDKFVEVGLFWSDVLSEEQPMLSLEVIHTDNVNSRLEGYFF